MAVNVTIFEKTGRIGGRTLTVNVFDDPNQPVELGASIFVKVNEILWTTVQNYSLPLQPAGSNDDDDGLLGIWDGDSFVYTQDDRSSGWWNLARLFWKYGMAPYRANKLMQATIDRFLALYRAPYFPFRSLTTRAYELELAFVTSQTGEQFLGQNNIAEAFAHDIVQASARVNYASNLGCIHGLDTMVSLAPQGASQVRGGNWRIFDMMVVASGAAFRPNTTVTGISLAKGADAATAATAATKYVVQTADVEEEFDNVVLASPFQFSGIEAGDGVLQATIDAIPYVKLHVTLFTSPFRFNASFFKLSPGDPVPTTILTTLAAGDDATSGVEGAGKAGFYSISTLRRVVSPGTLREQYLYKIFSPEKVTPAFLSDLFGVPVPQSFTREAAADAATNDVPPISWYYPHIFYSYPKALPRVTFQDPILGNGLYYTSGIESFISTMETSALMGKNVARLIVDDIQGLTTGEAVQSMENEEELGEL